MKQHSKSTHEKLKVVCLKYIYTRNTHQQHIFAVSDNSSVPNRANQPQRWLANKFVQNTALTANPLCLTTIARWYHPFPSRTGP